MNVHQAHKTIEYAEAARADGIKIISVGVTNRVDIKEIKAISSYPHDDGVDYFLVRNFKTLKTMAVLISSTTCDHSTWGFGIIM